MPMTAEPRFDELVEEYLGQQLPEKMAASFRMAVLPAETQDFIVRMLALMKQSGFSVTDFTPHLIHWISVTVPGTLPGAWGGRIPPLTLPGRHRKLDAYAVRWVQAKTAAQHLFVDIG